MPPVRESRSAHARYNVGNAGIAPKTPPPKTRNKQHNMMEAVLDIEQNRRNKNKREKGDERDEILTALTILGVDDMERVGFGQISLQPAFSGPSPVFLSNDELSSRPRLHHRHFLHRLILYYDPQCLSPCEQSHLISR